MTAPKPDVRTGQYSGPLSRDTFRLRFMRRFYDPAFQAELQRLHLQLASNAKPKPAAPTPPARQSVDQIMALYGYGGNSPATPL